MEGHCPAVWLGPDYHPATGEVVENQLSRLPLPHRIVLHEGIIFSEGHGRIQYHFVRIRETGRHLNLSAIVAADLNPLEMCAAVRAQNSDANAFRTEQQGVRR